MVDYSYQKKFEGTARAYAKELNISPKHAVEVCRAIRGKPLEKAKEYLQDVVDGKKAVPFRRYTSQVCHKRGAGPARYPKKACQKILKLLEDVSANAIYQGFNPENMKIIHIASYMGRTYQAYFPRARGSSSPKQRQTSNIEVVVKEMS